MNPKLAIRAGTACAALLAMSIPLRTQAGTAVVTSAHPVAINISVLAQDYFNGELRPDRERGTSKNILEACLDRPPTRTEALYLFIDCNDPTTNAIEAVNVDASTKPLATVTNLMTVGHVTFDGAHIVTTTRKTVATSATLPVQVAVSCNSGTTKELTLNLSGIVNLRLSPIGVFSTLPDTVCSLNAISRLTGTGFIGSDAFDGPGIDLDFLVNDGSSMTVKTRDRRIDTTTLVPGP
jgi:hypothetical protein